MQEYLSQVTQIKYLTLHVLELSVRLMAPTELSFTAGQYMQFKISDNIFRSYSIASPPRGDNPTVTFCIKLEPKGVGSDYVRTLKVGSDLLMRGPAGNFTIADFNRPIFFVATGVGIAPFASVIPDMLSRGYRENSRLLFGVRSEENVFYYDKFNRLAQQYDNFTFVPVMSQPQSHWPGETGYVTTYIEVSHQLFKDYVFYVCGTKQVVLDARQVLLEQGHDPNQIKLEIFTS